MFYQPGAEAWARNFRFYQSQVIRTKSPLHLHVFASDRVSESRLQSFPLQWEEDFALLQALARTRGRHLQLSTSNRLSEQNCSKSLLDFLGEFLFVSHCQIVTDLWLNHKTILEPAGMKDLLDFLSKCLLWLKCELSMTQFLATLLAGVAAEFPPLCCYGCRTKMLISFRTMSYVQASVLLCATYNTQPCRFKGGGRRGRCCGDAPAGGLASYKCSRLRISYWHMISSRLHISYRRRITCRWSQIRHVSISSSQFALLKTQWRDALYMTAVAISGNLTLMKRRGVFGISWREKIAGPRLWPSRGYQGYLFLSYLKIRKDIYEISFPPRKTMGYPIVELVEGLLIMKKSPW